jgi:hypothetical protein
MHGKMQVMPQQEVKKRLDEMLQQIGESQRACR